MDGPAPRRGIELAWSDGAPLDEVAGEHVGKEAPHVIRTLDALRVLALRRMEEEVQIPAAAPMLTPGAAAAAALAVAFAVCPCLCSNYFPCPR
eukprot:219224-Rhodomonas_salina.1